MWRANLATWLPAYHRKHHYMRHVHCFLLMVIACASTLVFYHPALHLLQASCGDAPRRSCLFQARASLAGVGQFADPDAEGCRSIRQWTPPMQPPPGVLRMLHMHWQACKIFYWCPCDVQLLLRPRLSALSNAAFIWRMGHLACSMDAPAPSLAAP